jgi:hypothetical protein
VTHDPLNPLAYLNNPYLLEPLPPLQKRNWQVGQAVQSIIVEAYWKREASQCA